MPKNSSELIPMFQLKLDDCEVNAVNARTLHQFMEIGDKYSQWIKRRVEEYGFIQDNDFVTISGKSTGGRPATEYHITIDMAKELAMVERNEKGRQARRYFIECEKKLRDFTLTPDQQREIQELVAQKVKSAGSKYQTEWGRIKSEFRVGSYKDIPSSRFEELKLFIDAPAKGTPVQYDPDIKGVLDLSNSIGNNIQIAMKNMLPPSIQTISSREKASIEALMESMGMLVEFSGQVNMLVAKR